MLIRRRWAGFTVNLASFLCVILFISIVAAPSFSFQPTSTGSNESKTRFPLGSSSNTRLVIQDGRAYFIEEKSVNELFNQLERSVLTSRSIHNIRHFALRYLNIFLPFAGFCVLVYCFGYFNRKNIRPKSMMALFIGGHAPPRIA